MVTEYKDLSNVQKIIVAIYRHHKEELDFKSTSFFKYSFGTIAIYALHERTDFCTYNLDVTVTIYTNKNSYHLRYLHIRYGDDRKPTYKIIEETHFPDSLLTELALYL